MMISNHKTHLGPGVPLTNLQEKMDEKSVSVIDPQDMMHKGTTASERLKDQKIMKGIKWNHDLFHQKKLTSDSHSFTHQSCALPHRASVDDGRCQGPGVRSTSALSSARSPRETQAVPMPLRPHPQHRPQHLPDIPDDPGPGSRCVSSPRGDAVHQRHLEPHGFGPRRRASRGVQVPENRCLGAIGSNCMLTNEDGRPAGVDLEGKEPHTSLLTYTNYNERSLAHTKNRKDLTRKTNLVFLISQAGFSEQDITS